MKLIAEHEVGNIQLLNEAIDESGEKSMFIEGIFAQAEKKNRNRRIYPKKVLEAAIDKYVTDYVKQNRAMGELNHPSCYLYNTFDVLTPSGWKPFTEIQVGDTVISMDESRKYVESKVLRKIEQPFINGDTYHFKGRHIDSKVTANHRFYCLDRNDNLIIKTAEELYKNSSHIRIIKNFAGFDADVKPTFVLEGVKVQESWRYQIPVWEDLELDAVEFCKFLGFWLAEGHIASNTYCVSVTQNSGDVAEEYKQVLRNLGINYTVTYNHRRNVCERIAFTDRRFYEFLKPLGDCYTKYIPQEVKNLPRECLIELLNWFAKGDGRKVSFGSDARKEYPLNVFSVSKRLIDDLNEIALKVGFSGKIHEFEPEGDYIFADHLIKAENKHTLYQFNISCVSGIHLDRRFVKIEKEHVNVGMAYCLTTEHGNFYVSDNGCQYLTGNCVMVDPERACMLIKSLEWNGNDVYGRAKILNTEKGKLVRTLIEDGVQLGVSTRGVGSIVEKSGDKYVGEDYTIHAIDCVSNPSGIDCWVDGILENVEFYLENGVLNECTVEEYLKRKRIGDMKQLQEDFKNFMDSLVIG